MERGVLFVASDGGAPRGWPFLLRWMDGGLWCTSYRKGAKMRWIESADEATVVLFADEREPAPYSVVDGTVEVITPTVELIERWMDAPYRPGAARVADRLASGQRVFIVVRPTVPATDFGAR
ncbi:MAG: hypothetical protein AB7L13_05895 [Acidimicrobiia bacterium]